MFVYICRHAWAGERGDPNWPDDSLRELTAEGIERYTNVVKALAKRGFAPTQIATSPYVRCRQTAELIAKYVDGDPAVEEVEALEPGSDLAALIKWTNARSDENVCWVGPCPGRRGFGRRSDRRPPRQHSLRQRRDRRDRLRKQASRPIAVNCFGWRRRSCLGCDQGARQYGRRATRVFGTSAANRRREQDSRGNRRGRVRQFA